MKQPDTFLKPKPICLVVLFWIGLLGVGLACSSTGPGESRAPEAFPNTDLIFTASAGIGFVNADGSNLSSLPLTAELSYGIEDEAWRPVITGDQRTVIVKMADQFWHVYNPIPLVLWNAGALPVPCLQWQEQQMAYLSSDQQDIFIQMDQGIARYKLNSCGTETAPLETHEDVFGVLSPDLQYVAYINRRDDVVHNRVVAIRDLASGEEQIVGEGNYPAWSRDSHWLAYTGPDGIYVYSLEQGIQPQRVIFYPNLFDEKYPTYFGAASWRIPPEVSWSPDGKWLVYHKWIGTDYNTGTDPLSNAIYKLNVETGEEIKIIDEGMYPFWRWPVEEP